MSDPPVSDPPTGIHVSPGFKQSEPLFATRHWLPLEEHVPSYKEPVLNPSIGTAVLANNLHFFCKYPIFALIPFKSPIVNELSIPGLRFSTSISSFKR